MNADKARIQEEEHQDDSSDSTVEGKKSPELFTVVEKLLKKYERSEYFYYVSEASSIWQRLTFLYTYNQFHDFGVKKIHFWQHFYPL